MKETFLDNFDVTPLSLPCFSLCACVRVCACVREGCGGGVFGNESGNWTWGGDLATKSPSMHNRRSQDPKHEN